MDHIVGDIYSQKTGQLKDALRPSFTLYNLNVDMVTYDWVKPFVKDREARAEIRRLQGQIGEIQMLPIDKDELRATLQRNLAAFRPRRIAVLRGNIEQAQYHIRLSGREATVFGPHNAYSTFGGPPGWVPFLDFELTDQEIDAIFKGLEQGVSRKEMDKRIAAIQKKIAELEKMIEKELSPKERWFYYPDGEPLPYPRGCQWVAFVEMWEEVAARYSEPVNVEGYKLKTAEERAAYGLLKLGEIEKRTPLREGAE
jgi:hypothetical protein